MNTYVHHLHTQQTAIQEERKLQCDKMYQTTNFPLTRKTIKIKASTTGHTTTQCLLNLITSSHQDKNKEDNYSHLLSQIIPISLTQTQTTTTATLPNIYNPQTLPNITEMIKIIIKSHNILHKRLKEQKTWSINHAYLIKHLGTD